MSQAHTATSLPSNEKRMERIDRLFKIFAGFYGHIWRSQFKSDESLPFTQKLWGDALEEFSDAVLRKAIKECRNFHKMPPTLPEMLDCCRNAKRRLEDNEAFINPPKEPIFQRNVAVAEFYMQQISQLLPIKRGKTSC